MVYIRHMDHMDGSSARWAGRRRRPGAFSEAWNPGEKHNLKRKPTEVSTWATLKISTSKNPMEAFMMLESVGFLKYFMVPFGKSFVWGIYTYIYIYSEKTILSK